MDEYSYISENGVVRQIRDLVAKDKDAEQDLELQQLQTEVSKKQPLQYVSGQQNIDSWTSTVVEGIEEREFVLTEDGFYKFVALMNQAELKSMNEITVYNLAGNILWRSACSSVGDYKVQSYIPLRAQRLRVTHEARGGTAVGTGTFTLIKAVTS